MKIFLSFSSWFLMNQVDKRSAIEGSSEYLIDDLMDMYLGKKIQDEFI